MTNSTFRNIRHILQLAEACNYSCISADIEMIEYWHVCEGRKYIFINYVFHNLHQTEILLYYLQLSLKMFSYSFSTSVMNTVVVD